MLDIKSMIRNGNAIGHRRLFLLCAVSWCVMLQCAVAQVVERSTMIAVGTSNRLDTYLSPQDYKGFDARFVSSVLRQKLVEDALITDLELTHDAGIDYTDNMADNANTLAGHYDFAFSMMHRWKMLDGKLTVRQGSAANGLPSYVSYVLGLYADDPTSLPLVTIRPAKAADRFVLGLGNAAVNAASGVRPTFSLISSPSPGGPYAVESSNETGEFEVGSSGDGSKFFKVRVDLP